MLACLAPLAADLVVTGADRAEIAVLVFPNMAALDAGGFDGATDGGALTDRRLLAEIRRRLAERDREQSGSSVRVARAVVLAEPPSMADSEMTAKGNLNNDRVLDRRRALLDRLYAPNDPAVVRL
jgi:feruloyl-CoA synthase